MHNTSLLFCFALVFTMCTHVSSAQSDSTKAGVMDQALAPAKILAARHEFLNNNMRGALTLYREVAETDPTNVTALYGIAQCHYNLKRYDLALEYLEKSIAARGGESNEDQYFYGQCFHRTARSVSDLDKAIDHFNKFLLKASKNSFEAAEAKRFIAQCEFAKNAIQDPAPVKIRNMGEVINSRFEEYAPSITADGSLLVFTSRRSGKIDKEGDYKYYEDIHFARRDPETGEWTDAEPLTGGVNTETHDAVLSIAPDGSGIFVYKNDGTNAGDIFFSKHNEKEDTWYPAAKIGRPVNTSFFEGSVSMTADGKSLYFISERMEGYGLGDIYVSHKKGDSWGNPKNLGADINTDMDEKFVFIHPNGKTLFFASNGHPGMGSYDIFKTELVNGTWTKPVNLGYPINTVNEESTFSLTNDNSTMYLSAEYDDTFGERDIYELNVSEYGLMSGGYDKSSYGQFLVTVTDAKGKTVKGVNVIIYPEGSTTGAGQAVTDRNGYARINVEGGKKYRIVARLGEDETETSASMDLKETGETVVRVPLII
ncbi:MAG: tetratricopeptide repeat protein [Flavobacteriales bacterium]